MNKPGGASHQNFRPSTPIRGLSEAPEHRYLPVVCSPGSISIAIITILSDTLGNSSPCHIWQLNQRAPFIYL